LAPFTRFVVFALASLSFACLLGEMYGLWPMRWFGCLVLPPATSCSPGSRTATAARRAGSAAWAAA
jgi:hypothetical protein